MTVITAKPVSLRGAVGRFARLVLTTRDADGWREFLIDGPAGTGKSMGILTVFDLLCWQYPGIQILCLRKIAKDCSDSIKMTLEDRVFANYEGGEHPAKAARRANRRYRSDYEYPNGSRIAFGGLDNRERLKSMEPDVVYVNEATEASRDDWEYCVSRARGNFANPAIPFNFCVADTNPDVPYHWLNQRPEEPDESAEGRTKMLRLKSQHRDNPTITEAYLRTLRALTGVRRKRLYEGLWVAAEGMVYEHFDTARHVVNKLEEQEWYFASQDFGFNDPGVMQIWGVRDGVMTLVAEVYRSNQDGNWWADVGADLWQEFRPAFGVADPSRPDSIKLQNQRLARRKVPGLWHKAKNDLLSGLDLVRTGLGQATLGPPKIRFYRGALRLGRDPELAAAGRPCSTVEELPAYRFLPDDPDKKVQERPDPLCADHGCDALRYAAAALWGKDLAKMRGPKTYAPGTYGDILGHAEAGL